MIAKASNAIRSGWRVMMTERLDGTLLIYPYISGLEFDEIIGTAARDIAKGETINYDPGANTPDIIVKTTR